MNVKLMIEEQVKIEGNSMIQTTKGLNAEKGKTEDQGKTAEDVIEVFYSTKNVLLLPVNL